MNKVYWRSLFEPLVRATDYGKSVDEECKKLNPSIAFLKVAHKGSLDC